MSETKNTQNQVKTKNLDNGFKWLPAESVHISMERSKYKVLGYFVILIKHMPFLPCFGTGAVLIKVCASHVKVKDTKNC